MAKKLEVSIDTEQLKKVSEDLSRLGYRADKRVREETRQFAYQVTRNVIRTVPRATGLYAKSFVCAEIRDDSVAHFSIYNPTGYGVYLEAGVEKGQPPWGINYDSKRTPKKKDRTFFSKGRIWSSQAVGGTINKYFNTTLTGKFNRLLGNAIMQELRSGK